MKRIFLGGRIDSTNVSHWMGSIYDSQKTENKNSGFEDKNNSFSKEGANADNDMEFIEVWDYVGGTSFRGFVADKELSRGRIEKTLFLFFEHVVGTQLKHGCVPRWWILCGC